VFSSIANQRNHSGYHADAHVCHSGCNHGSVTVVVGSGGRSGYYEYRQVKRGKPGYHTYVRDNCGRRVRIWREGYYTHDRVRVWVPIASHSYKYGNGHRRDYSQSYTNHRPDRHSGHDRDRNRENAYDRSHDRRH
jgi:hypothetical protein